MDRVIKNQNANETDYDKQFKEDMEKATALSMETLALEEFQRKRPLHSVGVNAGDLSGVSSSSSMKFSSCMCTIKFDYCPNGKSHSINCFFVLNLFLHFIAAQSNLSSISIKSTQPFQRPRPGSFGNSSTTGSSSSFGGSGSGSSNNNGKSSFPTSSSSGSLAPPPSNTPRNLNRTKANETDLISFAHPIDNNLSNDSLLLANDSAITAAAATAAAVSLTSPSTVNDSHSNFKQMVDEIHRYVMTIFNIIIHYM